MKKTVVITSSVVLAGICLLIFSCSNEPKEEPVRVKESLFKGFHASLDSILRKRDGIVHGFELGDSAKAVKAYEKKNTEEEDNDYFLYSYPIDSISNYTIAYTFVKDTLDEVELQINSKNIDTGTDILNSLKKYYSEKYTAPLMDKGIYVFNCSDSHKRNFKISLTDNSSADVSIINMLVYREK